MKHFILTSPQFTGSVTYKYCDAGYLIYFSYDATMRDDQREHVLVKMPLTLAGFNEVIGKSKTAKIEEVPEDISFDAFWEAYGKKINRKRSEPLYNKLSDADKMLCMRCLPQYDKYLARTGFRAKKDPDGFLRDRFFETNFNTLK